MLQAFGSVVEEKVQTDDSIMERVAMWTIDTKDMRAAGALLEISDMVLGELLAQVEANDMDLGYIAHVCLSAFPNLYSPKNARY